MPLPLPDVARKPMHTRTVRVEAFMRDDGLWDLDAELLDVKAYDFTKHSGAIHAAGTPVHRMHLRITIDDDYTIKAAVAAYDAAPYDQYCFAIAPDYGDLVGMNLLRGFRDAVKKRFGRTAGCTHMTELSHLFPTTAIQARAGRPHKPRDPGLPEKRPFQIEGCHALRADGEAVKEFYPKWYTGPGVKTSQ
jgi:hypothetical protein